MDLPRENRLRVQDCVSSGRPHIAILPGGSSERWLYPSISSWEIILQALARRFLHASFSLVGKLRSDGLTAITSNEAEVQRLLEARPRAANPPWSPSTTFAPSSSSLENQTSALGEICSVGE